MRVSVYVCESRERSERGERGRERGDRRKEERERQRERESVCVLKKIGGKEEAQSVGSGNRRANPVFSCL